MNRCARRPLGARGPGHWVATLVCALALLPTALFAQLRQFPEHALRGQLVINNPPEITVNDRPERLSPGARIRDTHNRIVFAQSLMGQPLIVHYTRESNGMVHEVWLLTPEEMAQPRAGSSDIVIRNYRSGTGAEAPPPGR